MHIYLYLQKTTEITPVRLSSFLVNSFHSASDSRILTFHNLALFDFARKYKCMYYYCYYYYYYYKLQLASALEDFGKLLDHLAWFHK